VWRAHAFSIEEQEERRGIMTARIKRRVKRELATERPTIWIGKEGKTTEMIGEIDRQLEIREMVKVRILNTALKEEKAENLALQVAEQTSSVLVEVRGHIFMLYRRRKKRQDK
jgi:putative YhbY family RNA-binding protein